MRRHARVEGRGVDDHDERRPRIQEVGDGVDGVVETGGGLAVRPDVLTHGNAELLPSEGDDGARVRWLEPPRLVEHVVGREERLCLRVEDRAVQEQRRDVDKALAGPCDLFLSTYPTTMPIPFGAAACTWRSAFRFSSTNRSYSSRSSGG